MPSKLINFALFQLGWFSSVLGAANNLPMLGPLAAIPILVFHLARANSPRTEIKLVAAAVIIGGGFDQLLVSVGYIQYRGSAPGYLPLWMIGLWIIFSTTLNVSLRWMHRRWAVAIIFGLIGGPLSYLGGIRLGAAEYYDATPALIAMAIGWGILTPVLLAAAERFDGYKDRI